MKYLVYKSVPPLNTHGGLHFLSGICSVEAADSLDTLQAITWDNVREATNSDPSMCQLLDYVEHGFPNNPIVERPKGGAKGLIDSLKRTFSTSEIPNELATDGGSEFTSSSTKNFLRMWGIDHRLSSVAFPHSNCRAEIGVKTVKRMITSNTSPTGELDTDAFRVAMLQYLSEHP